MQSIFQVLDKIIHLIEDIICGTTLAAIVAIATASVVIFSIPVFYGPMR